MKTFSEACEAVLLRQVKPNEDPAIDAKMDDTARKFKEMHDEIQNSKEATIFAAFLLDRIVDDDWPGAMALKVAFSHGVAVGMLMERQEEP